MSDSKPKTTSQEPLRPSDHGSPTVNWSAAIVATVVLVIVIAAASVIVIL